MILFEKVRTVLLEICSLKKLQVVVHQRKFFPVNGENGVQHFFELVAFNKMAPK